MSDKPQAATGNDPDPEFVDIPGLYARFAIKEGLAYALINRKAIKSVCLRERGKLRGKRLINVQSVRDYLAAQMDQHPASSADK